MPQEQAKKAKKPYVKPEITDLGNWPMAEGKIREWALAQGIHPQKIEILLDDIRQTRKRTSSKSTGDTRHRHQRPRCSRCGERFYKPHIRCPMCEKLMVGWPLATVSGLLVLLVFLVLA